MIKAALTLVTLALPASAALAISGSVSADYFSAYVGDDPSMIFGIRVQETLPFDLKLSLSQSINRHLVVDASKDEWELADTNLSITQSFEHTEKAKVTTRLLSTLPLSRDSQYEDLYTRTELRSTYALELPYNLVSESTLLGSLYFYKYDSTKVEGQESGGDALPRNSWGFSQGLTYNFHSDFSFSVEGDYREKRYYDLRKTASHIATQNRLVDHAYSVSAFLSYIFKEQTAFSLSYQQGSSLERPGYEDFVVFDKEESSWNVSVVHSWK